MKIEPEGPLTSSNTHLQLAAALAGVGFHAAFEGNVSEHIAAGRLVSVLEDWLPSFPGPFLYYPGRRQLPAALRAFIDFARVKT